MTLEKYSVENQNLEAVGLSIPGQVRSANEDSCGYERTPNGELFVVCDGMGGHVGGATASRIGVESIVSYMMKNRGGKAKLLHDALVFANLQILGTASSEPSLKGMGTTACVVLIDGEETWIAHVGDSRIYLFSKEEKTLFRITKDHSYVQGLVDQGQLDDRDAENHPQKNIILKALGTKMDVVPEVAKSPMRLAKGDIIMICSDGLSGMIDDNQIESILQDKIQLEDKLKKLIEEANAPGKGKDNITCQLIQINESSVVHNVHPDFNPRWRRDNVGGGIKPQPKPKIWLWVVCGVVGLIVMVVSVLLIHNCLVKNRKNVSVEIAVGNSKKLKEICEIEYDTFKLINNESSVITLNKQDSSFTANKIGNAKLVVFYRSAWKLFLSQDSVVYDLKVVSNQAADRQREVTKSAQAEAEKQKREAETAKAEADKQKKEAETAKAEADKQKKEAETAKAEAEKQKREAETAKAEAEKQKKEAEKAKAEAEKQKQLLLPNAAEPNPNNAETPKEPN